MKTGEPRSGCPIARALDLFGDRWTLLVLRDILVFEKQRFREFLASPEGIASNILTNRLRRLEATGLVSRSADPLDRRRRVYAATDKARTLLPLLTQIAAWGREHAGDVAPVATGEPIDPSGDDTAK